MSGRSHAHRVPVKARSGSDTVSLDFTTPAPESSPVLVLPWAGGSRSRTTLPDPGQLTASRRSLLLGRELVLHRAELTDPESVRRRLGDLTG
ncbi:hypothetical protein ABZ770_22005 [Streptomyces sp. NPDC006654]|uniref:hypothetical protein n=1 Tax=unclassified Streptomyces TaxID=2593676 RepID=UPI0033DDA366